MKDEDSLGRMAGEVLPSAVFFDRLLDPLSAKTSAVGRHVLLSRFIQIE
jgi:hypothetical protein